MKSLGPHCLLGECPLWDPRLNRLYLIDIDGRNVHRIDPDSNVVETKSVPGRPGSMVLTPDVDRLVVALEHQLVELRWDSGTTMALVDLESGGPGKRLNDGRCDPAGRYWVGSMDDPHDAMTGSGTLYSVSIASGAEAADSESRFAVSEHRSGICVSNGMAFSPDGTVMYWADSPRGTVWRYDVDLDSGERHGERVFLDFSQGLPGAPDGACVDESGCYWVACVTGAAMLRATPDGRVDRIVDLPVNLPTMPAFGGPDLDTMFITSISDGVEGAASNDGHKLTRGGVTLALDVGVRGVVEPLFGL